MPQKSPWHFRAHLLNEHNEKSFHRWWKISKNSLLATRAKSRTKESGMKKDFYHNFYNWLLDLCFYTFIECLRCALFSSIRTDNGGDCWRLFIHKRTTYDNGTFLLLSDRIVLGCHTYISYGNSHRVKSSIVNNNWCLIPIPLTAKALKI